MRATELLVSLMHDINTRHPERTPIRFLYQERCGVADQNYAQGMIRDYHPDREWSLTERNDVTGESTSRNKYFHPLAVVSDLRGRNLRLADLRDIVLESEM